MKKRVIIALIIGLGLNFFEPISFEYVCKAGEYQPSFYGFPFVYRTNLTWGGSMSADMYLFGVLGNWLFWSLLVFPFTVLIKTRNRLLRVVAKSILFIAAVFSLLIVWTDFGAVNWNYEYSHKNLYRDYHGVDVTCERKILIQ